jgi:hypothetical protein
MDTIQAQKLSFNLDKIKEKLMKPYFPIVPFTAD